MTNTETLQALIEDVWNNQQTDKVGLYIADEYTIRLDTGDPWEGKTLNHSEYKARLRNSFDPFPDMHFHILTTVSDGDQVGITWRMTGTNLGSIGGYPATGKSIETYGMTIYHFRDGKVIGHSQVFDRGVVARQLGFGG